MGVDPRAQRVALRGGLVREHEAAMALAREAAADDVFDVVGEEREHHGVRREARGVLAQERDVDVGAGAVEAEVHDVRVADDRASRSARSSTAVQTSSRGTFIAAVKESPTASTRGEAVAGERLVVVEAERVDARPRLSISKWPATRPASVRQVAEAVLRIGRVEARVSHHREPAGGAIQRRSALGERERERAGDQREQGDRGGCARPHPPWRASIAAP